ncbi:MAG TPA: hypothetical protein PK944_06835 [Agitococcus sp.]|nr:hypothetical protein [Agitococcus sp.]
MRLILAAASLSLVLVSTSAHSDNNNNNQLGLEPNDSGWSLNLDNDLFTVP